MRKTKFCISLSFILILLFSFDSCISIKTTGSGKVPPGQVKKITGSQSAKPYAPGQNK
ncbi:hypothetical protein JGH11_01455 [Dysgonomonas sp. Marseille-P4677]|uniref:hypothetical protein n=1 Tax=Dysgonomonas sp. Marseille-P4677 TaxID=2364790 RepID=UPI0019145D62|nr:hypothetical protein [Dysgonomonas sp. Marseille-P4677]MBK5719529.1 hypothetical protein [Dysgonomonas sp. Marseille-P4677]